MSSVWYVSFLLLMASGYTHACSLGIAPSKTPGDPLALIKYTPRSTYEWNQRLDPSRCDRECSPPLVAVPPTDLFCTADDGSKRPLSDRHRVCTYNPCEQTECAPPTVCSTKQVPRTSLPCVLYSNDTDRSLAGAYLQWAARKGDLTWCHFHPSDTACVTCVVHTSF
jgi:hypothetical protein